MNVRKSNPLNRLYHLWVELGGKVTPVYTHTHTPTPDSYSDNLCHFMRVVLIWVWFRWLFMRRWMFKDIKGGVYLSPFLIGGAAFLLGVFTSLLVHYPNFRKAMIVVAVIGMGTALIIYTLEFTRVGKWMHDNQEAGMIRRRKWWAPKKEAFQLFKDWLYAKKMRVCPQIKVDL